MRIAARRGAMPALARRASRLLLSLSPARLLRSLGVALSLAAAGLAHAQSSEPSLPSLWAPKEAWDAPEPWRTDRWYVQFAYYTWHFHYDPAHKQAYAVDTEYRFNERWLDGQWIVGLTLFQNSFGQFSEYLYGALQWRPIKEHQPFYVKVSAGLLHGYEGQYKDKIPFNSTGTAPAIIPGVGYCWVRYCGEFVLLGANAALFMVGVTVP
jgi:hypothetical protein